MHRATQILTGAQATETDLDVTIQHEHPHTILLLPAVLRIQKLRATRNPAVAGLCSCPPIKLQNLQVSRLLQMKRLDREERERTKAGQRTAQRAAASRQRRSNMDAGTGTWCPDKYACM